MSWSGDNALTCSACNKSFSAIHYLNRHQTTCRNLGGQAKTAIQLFSKFRAEKSQAAKARPAVQENSPPRKRRRTIPQETSTAQYVDEQPQLSHADPITEPHEAADNRKSPAGEPTFLDRKSRITRNRQPARFADAAPELPELPAQASDPIPEPAIQPTHRFKTPLDGFHMLRIFYGAQPPAHDPDRALVQEQLEKQLSQESEEQDDSTDPISQLTVPHPFPNWSSFALLDWFWNRNGHSQENFMALLNILNSPLYSPNDIKATRWDYIQTVLGEEECEWLDSDAGWIRCEISLTVPFHKRRGFPTPAWAGPREFPVAEFFHKNLVSIIRERMTDPHHSKFHHYEPYEQFWHPNGPEAPAIRVFGELYSSPAFMEAHVELQNSPPEPDCCLPRVIVALMFWSDATQLTTFGNSKLWPLYLFLGNDSKYRRCKPSCYTCIHVAYFQTLPNHFKDFARAQTAGGQMPSRAFFTHCQRELMHEQWALLLDDEFIVAWKHGIVLTGHDGIQRRFYPRIFSYSGDYPEKIMLSGVRNLGRCPCPRCFIELKDVPFMGQPDDMRFRAEHRRQDNLARQKAIQRARKLILDKNAQVNSKGVENLLSKNSWVPIDNAFSRRLSPLGVNLFLLFLVDFMHEWSLGVLVAIILQLLRIIEHFSATASAEVDKRYRTVQSFGQSIRKFSRNCSEMKHKTARDMEDMLICAIPVFEGLIPEPYNTQILCLLFVANEWQGLTKLRLHTDQTLPIQSQFTGILGDELRRFKDKVCDALPTKELNRETAARVRRKAKQKSKLQQSQSHKAAQLVEEMQRRPKTLNLNTYKLHALGDYTETIRQYGTVDSYSTEQAEQEHKTSKDRFGRTNKRQFLKQITQIERRQARLRRIRKNIEKQLERRRAIKNDRIPNDPQQPYNIGKSCNSWQNLVAFLQDHNGDPAIKAFYGKLKQHLLSRIQDIIESCKAGCHDATMGLPGYGLQTDSSNSVPDVESIFIQHERLYLHPIVRFNYTSYDLQRAQDITHSEFDDSGVCDIMLLREADSGDDVTSHRFLYARVLRIFHVDVVWKSSTGQASMPIRKDVLWVRWFDHTERIIGDAYKMDMLRFPSVHDEDSFGFVDPMDVLRGCHLIPRFAAGQVTTPGQSKVARDSRDWNEYYITRWVDRDMLMRFYWGLGIGHRYSHADNPSAQDLNGLPSLIPLVSDRSTQAAQSPQQAQNDPVTDVDADVLLAEDDNELELFAEEDEQAELELDSRDCDLPADTDSEYDPFEEADACSEDFTDGGEDE